MTSINVIDVGAAGPGLSIPGFECNVTRFEPRDGTCALSNVEGNQTLFITRDPMASSLRVPGHGIHSYWNQSMFDIMDSKLVWCQRLDNITTPDTIHLIKVDTQGTEWEVLNGACMTLRKTIAVLCEVEFVELYSGQYMFADVVSLLHSCGFAFIDFTDGERVRGRRIWADALFHRADIPLHPLVGALNTKSPLRRLNHLLRSEGLWHWDNMLRRPFRRTPQ